jgi:hypothetical protein
MQTIRTRAAFRYFEWNFRCAADGLCIEGRISAPREAFVGLTYYNPPGGTKQCLNTKLAACEVTITGHAAAPEILSTAHRAAFEILTDDTSHGIPMTKAGR